MDGLTALGRALGALRSLQGRSVQDIATSTGLTREQVVASERGTVTPSVRETLTACYGLDAQSLVDGSAAPGTGNTSFTTFLLHGPNQDFDARDLQVFERALRAARFFGGLPVARQGLDHRLACIPVGPAGPEARDAAHQGYRLARKVRDLLGLGGGPVGDIRALLEDSFGILVLVDRLATTDLRAASVLDAERASAVAVLAHDDESRQRNPRLARVYLAHELCHLLFDPAGPGCVQIALDEKPQQAGRTHTGGISATQRLEARAKGFAAEFLIPDKGVADLLGQRSAPASDINAARALVVQVRRHFNTPWEMAVRHLGNLGWIDRHLVAELLDVLSRRPERDTSTLPAPGRMPRSITRMPGADVLAATPRHPSTVPAYVAAVQRIAHEAVQRSTHEILAKVYDSVSRSAVMESTDLLVGHIDALLSGSEMHRVSDILDAVDVRRLEPSVATGVLSLTWHAKEKLGAHRAGFLTRVLDAMETTWGIPATQREKIAARLR